MTLRLATRSSLMETVPSLRYFTNANSTSNLTTYSFTSFNITAQPPTHDRLVIVDAFGVTFDASDNSAMVSMTIGSVAATKLVELWQGPYINSLWFASVPHGQLITIAPTFGEQQTFAEIAVWGASGVKPAAAYTDSNGSASADTFVLTNFRVPSDGFGVFGLSVTTNVGSTWTNATERLDSGGDGAHSVADRTIPGIATITADPTGTVAAALVGASFEPY